MKIKKVIAILTVLIGCAVIVVSAFFLFGFKFIFVGEQRTDAVGIAYANVIDHALRNNGRSYRYQIRANGMRGCFPNGYFYKCASITITGENPTKAALELVNHAILKPCLYLVDPKHNPMPSTQEYVWKNEINNNSNWIHLECSSRDDINSRVVVYIKNCKKHIIHTIEKEFVYE